MAYVRSAWVLVPVEVKVFSKDNRVPCEHAYPNQHMSVEDCTRALELVEFDSKDEALHWLDSRFELSDE